MNEDDKMQVLQIRKPLWDGRKVGVATDRITEQGILVEILYKDKKGNRIHPNFFLMGKEEALSYDTMTVKGRELKIIPINDFKSMKFKED